MNRNEYLRESSVKAFIDWLRPHVRGDYPFQHAFTMRRPRRAWSCNSIWEAYENYYGSSHKCMHDSGMISPITRRPKDEE